MGNYNLSPTRLVVLSRCVLIYNFMITLKFKGASEEYDTLRTLISVFSLLDAQNLFHNKFYFMPLHVSSTCSHHQEFKIALHSLWDHQTYNEHICSKHVEA